VSRNIADKADAAEASPLGAVPHYPPGLSPADAEEELSAAFHEWTTPVDVVPEHFQTVAVQGQRPHTAVLLLPGHSFAYSHTAFGAERMTPRQSCATQRTGKCDARFEVQDRDAPLSKINIIYLQRESLRDATAQPYQKPDEDLVPKALSCALQSLRLFHFEICLHLSYREVSSPYLRSQCLAEGFGLST
jgi:hypothetical protein